MPRGTRIECVALAPPPVYRAEGRPLPDRIADAIAIYINRQDCVPRLSLASIAKLVSMVKAVDKLKLSPSEQLRVLSGLGGEESGTNLKRIIDAVDGIEQDRFPFLEHPGRINYMYSVEDLEGFRIAKENSQTFSHKLVLLEWMVLHHLEPYYREAFDKVIVD